MAMYVWVKVKFAKSRRRADIKCKFVKSKRKPRKGSYHIVYGPFDSMEKAKTYLSIGDVKV